MEETIKGEKMKNLIKAEETGVFLLALYLFFKLNYPWWVFPVLLFIPDISMAGYAVNNKIGAILYNTIHHRGISILVFIFGILVDSNSIALAGNIMFAHSTFDRIFGFGLKHYKGFKFTSLGDI